MLDLYQIAEAYQAAVKRIKELVKQLPYKVSYIMEQLHLEKSQYYARLNREEWEPQHLLIFAKLQKQAGLIG